MEGVETVEGYTDWMKGIFTPLPDASYEVRSFAVDDARQNERRTACSAERIPARAGQCRQRASGSRRITLRHGFRRRSNRHLTKIGTTGSACSSWVG